MSLQSERQLENTRVNSNCWKTAFTTWTVNPW